MLSSIRSSSVWTIPSPIVLARLSAWERETGSTAEIVQISIKRSNLARVARNISKSGFFSVPDILAINSETPDQPKEAFDSVIELRVASSDGSEKRRRSLQRLMCQLSTHAGKTREIIWRWRRLPLSEFNVATVDLSEEAVV